MTIAPDKPRCVGRVPGAGQWGGFHMRQCSKAGTVEREGKLYCGTHDPVARQAKRDKSYTEYSERMGRRVKEMNWAHEASKVCNGLSIEKLKELGDGWLAAYLAEKAKRP